MAQKSAAYLRGEWHWALLKFSVTWLAPPPGLGGPSSLNRLNLRHWTKFYLGLDHKWQTGCVQLIGHRSACEHRLSRRPIGPIPPPTRRGGKISFTFDCPNTAKFCKLIFSKMVKIWPSGQMSEFKAKMHQILFRLGFRPR